MQKIAKFMEMSITLVPFGALSIIGSTWLAQYKHPNLDWCPVTSKSISMYVRRKQTQMQQYLHLLCTWFQCPHKLQSCNVRHVLYMFVVSILLRILRICGALVMYHDVLISGCNNIMVFSLQIWLQLIASFRHRDELARVEYAPGPASHISP